jgi:hypothetical protein
METVNIQAETMPTRTDDVKVIITKQETLNTNNQDFLDSNPNPESLLQFRHLGYTNQSTIGDICDNSIDTNVESSIVKINIKQSKDVYQYVEVIDDGSGMDRQILEEALKLGSRTGKSRKNDLGSYGMGLKVAASAIGLKFEVFTKSENDNFLIASYDIEEKIEKNSFRTPVRIGNNDEFLEFKEKTQSDTGTIIKISKIDNIKDGNASQFAGTIKKYLGRTFKYFLENNIRFYVNDKEVSPVDPLYRNESFSETWTKDETFEYKGFKFKFTVVYINPLDKSHNETLDFKRNQGNAGLYIYRNYRLVGTGLDLGLIGKLGDGHLNGLRIELHTTGDADSLFGSTLTKMVHEKDGTDIDQGFRDKCLGVFGSYISRAKDKDKKDSAAKKTDKELKEKMERIKDGVNQNKFITIPRTKGRNQPDPNPKIKPTPTGRKNKPHTRERRDQFINHEIVSLQTGEVFVPYKVNGEYIIQLNENHPFFSDFLINLNEEQMGYILKMFYSFAISLENTGFYSDSIKQNWFSEYFNEWSVYLRKMILY